MKLLVFSVLLAVLAVIFGAAFIYQMDKKSDNYFFSDTKKV